MVAVLVSPTGLEQIIITSLTINSGGVAWASIGKNKEVPVTKENASTILLFLTKEEINLVNAFFQSVHLVFHGTAPVWL